MKRKIIVGLFVAFIFAFGFYGINNLDKELFPEVDFNQAMVMVDTDEMTAEDVKQFVTIPIEQALDGIEGIKDVQSSSTTTGSSIMIEMDNKDADDITKEIESEVTRLKSDLYGVNDMMVMQATKSGEYEMFIDISGADGKEMSADALDVVKPRLEALPEVREIQITGLEENEVVIIPKEKKLNENGLSEQDIIDAIEHGDQSQTL